MNYVILMSSSSENDKTQPTDTATHKKIAHSTDTLLFKIANFFIKGKTFFDNLPATVTHPSTYVSINYFFCNSIALFEG